MYKRLQRVFSYSSGYYHFQNLDPNIYKVSAFYPTEERKLRKYGEYEELVSILINCDSK